MLNDAEKEDLHLAMLGWLELQGFNKTKIALKEAANVSMKLERKHRKVIPQNWRAIVKLRKQISLLEEKNKQLKEDINNFGVVKKDADPMPRKPAKHIFDSHSSVITDVKFHPKYPSLASASEDATIVVWNADSGAVEQTLKGHQDAVNAVAFHPKGNQLASCSADMKIKLWDVDAGNCTKTIDGHDHNVSSIVYSKCGKYLLSASRDKTIKKWDVGTGAPKIEFKGHDDWVRYICVSPDKKTFASCCKQQIKIWRLGNAKGEPEGTFKGGHSDIIENLCYSNYAADEIIIKHLLTGDIQKEEKAAFAERKQKYASQDEEKTKSSVDPGGAFLLSGSRDKSIIMWSLTTGKIVFTWKDAHDNWVRGLVFHPTGKYFVSCSDDKSIKVWNLKENAGKTRLKIDAAHELFVSSIDWCSSMDLMATGGVDNKVKIWDCTP